MLERKCKNCGKSNYSSTTDVWQCHTCGSDIYPQEGEPHYQEETYNGLWVFSRNDRQGILVPVECVDSKFYYLKENKFYIDRLLRRAFEDNTLNIADALIISGSSSKGLELANKIFD